MVEIVRRLIVAGISFGIIVGNADEIERFYNETVAFARQVATAADIRSIGNMLDYEYLKRKRYPKTGAFDAWMRRAFKEGTVKENTIDHWGTPLAYRAARRQKGYVLVSAGPDRIFETGDDLKQTGP